MHDATLEVLLSRERRDLLTAPERRLLESATTLGPAVFREVDSESDRLIHADLIHWLCTDPKAIDLVHSKGVWIQGAVIPEKLDFEGAVLPRTLILEGCDLEGELILRDARTRTIRLTGSRLKAFTAEGLRADGSIYLGDTVVDNGVDVNSARIEGALILDRALLGADEHGRAVDAARARVRGRGGMKQVRAHGRITLAEAEFQTLTLEASHISPQPDPEGRAKALSARGLRVLGDADLRGVRAEGSMTLVGARIDGKLDLSGATLSGDTEYAVNARGLRVGQVLYWRDMAQPPTSLVRLSYARVGQLGDDMMSWPEAGDLLLDGFVYDGFARGAPSDSASRLAWLDKQRGDGFHPQPFEQLAKVFRTNGREREARLVLIAKEDARRKRGDLRPLERAWLSFYGTSVRYGYESWRVVGFMLLMVLVGWRVFLAADLQSTTAEPPALNEFVYALEVFVPLVDLHQERYYLPRAGAPFQFYFWIHIVLGWVSSTFLAASVTGLIRKA